MPDPKWTYRRGGLYWARFTHAGQTFRFPLHTRDAKAAGRRAREERDRIIGQVRFGEVRVTFDDAFRDWSTYIQRQVSPTTAQRYAVSLAQLGPWLSGKFMDEIDRALIQTIVKARQKVASNATVRRDLTALSSVLDFAEHQGWRDDNPAQRASRRLRERRDPITLPTDDDIERVIALCPGMFDALVRAAWLTGARQSELVYAERRGLNGGVLTIRGKGNKVRALDLSPAAAALLHGLPARLGCPLLFWHGNGKPFLNLASRFAAKVRTAQKASHGFRPFRFHDLRHRYAVDYLRDGGSIYTLKGLMGHTSVKTTEGYLAYLTPEEAESAKREAAQ